MVTPEQYEHWKDFALRMARVCFRRKRNPNAAEIESNVQFFFDCLDPEDLLSIRDWDHSDPYPEGSKRHGLDCWGHPETAMSVTDMCKEHEEAWAPCYWCDMPESKAYRIYEQWVAPVVCCIRAGLDMAVSPSAGVAGFTAGDIRRMYPEGPPDWITGGKDHHWFEGFDGKVNGTFAEMPDNAGVWL